MTVTKRVITKAERQAATVAAIAARVVERWPKVEDVAAALAPPTLRAAAPHDGGRASGHPDPTAVIALGHPGYDDLRDAVEAWVEQGKWIEQRQIQFLKEHPDIASAKRDDLKGLCTEPGCDFRAERRGLCWHHYRNVLHTPDQAHHHASTPDVLESANSSVVGLLTATSSVVCGQCGWTVEHDGTDHTRALELLAAHKAEAHAA